VSLRPTLVLTLAAAGCDRTVRTCDVVERQLVEPTEVTPVGTAADLLVVVETDEVLAGTWWDGTPVEVDLLVVAEGPVYWVETVAGRGVIRLGIGHNDMAFSCSNGLEIPLAVEVSTRDGGLAMSVEGAAWVDEPVQQQSPTVWVFLKGPFAAATFPEADEDPGNWENKAASCRSSMTRSAS
jgi:hypothetical protein